MNKKFYIELIFLIFLGGATSLSLPPFNYLIINFLTFTSLNKLIPEAQRDFDEVWKINHEGEYGAYWGLWNKDGKYKFNEE